MYKVAVWRFHALNGPLTSRISLENKLFVAFGLSGLGEFNLHLEGSRNPNDRRVRPASFKML
jgi:hypothetical protein